MDNESKIINTLSTYLKTNFGISNINKNSYLIKDLGLDSLNLVDFAIFISDLFHTTLNLREDKTIGDIAKILRK